MDSAIRAEGSEEESEEEDDEEEEDEEGSGSGSESGTGSSDDEEEEDSDEEDESEPVLKYRRFAKDAVASINEGGRADLQIHIHCIAVHHRVRGA